MHANCRHNVSRRYTEDMGKRGLLLGSWGRCSVETYPNLHAENRNQTRVLIIEETEMPGGIHSGWMTVSRELERSQSMISVMTKRLQLLPRFSNRY